MFVLSRHHAGELWLHAAATIHGLRRLNAAGAEAKVRLGRGYNGLQPSKGA